jgi:cysteine synthase
METLVIYIPDKKSALVKQLLKELGVTFNATNKDLDKKNTPNALTKKTIEDAHNGLGLDKPIKNISDFISES